jgi:hypothetical protein
MVERMVSGGVAGMISQKLIYPFEIAKTRLALAKPGTYNGILDCWFKIIELEGASKIYRGWGVSVLGVAPFAAIDLAVFSGIRDLYC